MPQKLTDEERKVVVGIAKAAWIFIVSAGVFIKEASGTRKDLDDAIVDNAGIIGDRINESLK